MYPYYPTQQNYGYNVMRQPTTACINGRIVTNVEEARAAQIDLDGSQWYFPCPSEGKIYSKTISMQGLPVFQVYELKKNVENSIQDIDKSKLLLTLQSRIEKLESVVKGMNKNESVTDDEPLTV